MPAQPEVVTVVVDGYALQGWQGVNISRSIEEAAIGFELEASNPEWSADGMRLRRGKQIEIYTTPEGEFGEFDPGGGDLLCTGYVDTYSSSMSAGSHRVQVTGRSKAADAIDCEPVKHETGRVENKDLVGVAKEFDEWGLAFDALAALPMIPEVQRQPGETMFQTLEREARRIGVFMTGQPDGSVQIAKGPGPRHAGALILGEEPFERYQLTDRLSLGFSECTVRGQQSLGVDDEAMRQEEKAENGEYGRHRPLLLENEGSDPKEDLKGRAQWELDRRNGAQLSLRISVATWRDDGSAIWEPRRLIYVSIPFEQIEQDFAIQSLELVQITGEGEGAGTSAELTLVLPHALGSAQ